jgi:hypothetical protein
MQVCLKSWVKRDKAGIFLNRSHFYLKKKPTFANNKYDLCDFFHKIYIKYVNCEN